MTKKELIEKLKLCESDDVESGHIRMDRLLLEFIDDEDVTKVFMSIRKWYA